MVSWNICFHSPDPAARASAVADYLNTKFGETPGYLAIMLQEVRPESLQAVLQNTWIQRNFLLSNLHPPESLYTDIPGDHFTMRTYVWQATPTSFPLMMVSKALRVTDCFRVPFNSTHGRDALVIDIGLHDSNTESIRLCTAHLDPPAAPLTVRHGQAALISKLLKESPMVKSKVIAGLVGGDMNPRRTEHEIHKAENIGLCDAWENCSSTLIPQRKRDT